MHFHDPASNGQTQPKPAIRCQPFLASAPEWLKDLLQVFRRDADAGISNFDFRLTHVGGRTDGDRASGIRVLNGIQQQVVHDLIKS